MTKLLKSNFKKKKILHPTRFAPFNSPSFSPTWKHSSPMNVVISTR